MNRKASVLNFCSEEKVEKGQIEIIDKLCEAANFVSQNPKTKVTFTA